MTVPSLPYGIVPVRGELAEQTLLRMRADLQPGGQVPVIVGDAGSAHRLVESWGHDGFDFDAALRIATTLQPDEWFQGRLEEDPEEFASLEDSTVYPAGAEPMTRLQVGFEHSGRPLREVLIAQIPTSDYWAIPLHLRFGGWNACPEPSVHALIARHWEERYGARIAVLTSDTIEFTVESPPVSAEDCARLAWEQYLYCADIVDQGVGSVPTLAAGLRGSKVWYFWWD